MNMHVDPRLPPGRRHFVQNLPDLGMPFSRNCYLNEFECSFIRTDVYSKLSRDDFISWHERTCQTPAEAASRAVSEILDYYRTVRQQLALTGPQIQELLYAGLKICVEYDLDEVHVWTIMNELMRIVPHFSRIFLFPEDYLAQRTTAATFHNKNMDLKAVEYVVNYCAKHRITFSLDTHRAARFENVPIDGKPPVSKAILEKKYRLAAILLRYGATLYSSREAPLLLSEGSQVILPLLQRAALRLEEVDVDGPLACPLAVPENLNDVLYVCPRGVPPLPRCPPSLLHLCCYSMRRTLNHMQRLPHAIQELPTFDDVRNLLELPDLTD